MTAIFPLAVWQPGTLQPSTPVNDNALRVEVLQRGAISILSTPPGSPADGDVHIVGASPTGAWSTFAQHDVVMWRSGTWYRFAPFTGWLKQVGSDVRRFTGSAWDVVSGGSGGGAVPVQDEGTTVVASPTAINFVGAGVSATNSDGVATVTIPGGGSGSSEQLWPSGGTRRAAARKAIIEWPNTATAAAPSPNNYIFHPFTVGRTINVSALGIELTAASAGNKCRLGIYSNTFTGGNDVPGALLVQTADISTATPTGYKSAAAVVTLQPGNLYWVAFVCTGGSFATRSGEFPMLGRTPDANLMLYTALVASAGAWTDLPATAPAVSLSTLVGYKVITFFEE